MKLKEIKSSDMKTDDHEARVTDFMEANDIKNWSIREDGKVDVDEDFHVWDKDVIVNGGIPFQLGKVLGDVYVMNCGLTELGDWVPEKSRRFCVDENSIDSLTGFDGKQDIEIYSFEKNSFKDLHNIHKFISKAQSITFYNCPIKKQILGICLIEGLKRLNDVSKAGCADQVRVLKPIKDTGEFEDTETGEVHSAMTVAFLIVGKHMGDGKTGLLAAQNELLEFDLDDYAEI